MKFLFPIAFTALAVFAQAQFRPGIRPPYSPWGRETNDNETIKYVITFPSIIQKSKDFAFNMILFQDTSYSLPVSFRANLTSSDTLLATQTFTQTNYGLQSHTFSNLKSANLLEDAYPSIQIEFNTDGLENYTDITGGERVLTEQFVFIQTDKAMYKPSQTVQFRAVAINRNLAALTGAVNVTLQDSKSNQLKMWTNEPLTKGVFGGSYKLSDFVNLGDWKITLTGKGIPTTEKTFTVQQYVLPKYEVKLDVSQVNKNGYWLFNGDDESGYQGFVRAKYTFGKSVKGTAVITLMRTGGCSYAYDYPGGYYYYPRGNPESQKNVTKLVIKVPLAGDGSANDGKFTLNGGNQVITYNPYSSNYYDAPTVMVVPVGIEKNGTTTSTTSKPTTTTTRPPVKPQMTSNRCELTFQINVTEELTGEKITGDGSIMLYRDPYKITVHDSVQKTLKPGLPFTMRFQIATPDDQPVGAGVPIDLEVYYFNANNTYQYGRIPCGAMPSYYRPPVNQTPAVPDASTKGMLTDDDGLVSIKANIPKGTTSVLFKARVVGSTIDLCETRSPPQSKSKQAISIAIDRPISAAKTIPKVGDRLTFKISATFRAPMVYFLVVQNGQPFDYRQLANPTSIDDVATIYSVDVALPSEAAPRCSAVVWTVENSTGSDILADAIEFKVDGFIRQNVSAAFTPATVRPRDSVSLTVSTSEANSYVALLAVDKSVRLLKSGNDITLDDVIGAVGEGSQSGSYRPVMPLIWRCWRCGWWPWWIDSSNADSVFSGVGMTIKSNIRTGYSFFPYMAMARNGGEVMFARGMVGAIPQASGLAPEAVTATHGSASSQQPEPQQHIEVYYERPLMAPMPGPMGPPGAVNDAGNVFARAPTFPTSTALAPPPGSSERFYDKGIVSFGGPNLLMASANFRPAPAPLPPGAVNDNSIRNKDGTSGSTPTVRVLFPETWIWQINSTNGQGNLNLALTAPDTITSWVLTAFAVGDKNGFGAMENPAELTVFQDFFVNLDISQPTIIRGEQVQVKAVIFNYQTTPASIDLLLKQSNDFEVSLDDGVTFASADFRQTVTVQPNGGNSVPIWIKPTRLGTIKMTLQGTGAGGFSDAMEKEVLVEPEGEIRYANKPLFIRLTETNGAMKSTIEVAKMLGEVQDGMIVQGSKMFQLQAIGDILGPALSQLGNQIRLPTGCGEQTMVVLAPNVYIYNYLKSVNLLTDELSTKTTGFVEQGYQRELTYQRNDGGFSAFGNTDTESSTWLTAFVLRCFAAAKKYVNTQIPDAPVNKAWAFMALQANKNGTFQEPGRVLHHSMKGGATSDVNLAAYIYTTAAESGVDIALYTNTRELIINAGRNNATRDPYQLAVIAYALSIRSEDRAIGQEIMRRLMTFASMDGGFTYWKPANDQTDINEYAQSGPTQIETSAYALMAHLNLNNMTDDAIPIGRWLMSKRNSLGGFASTQDTVVGLQAISTLASLMSSGGQTFTVNATLNFQDNISPITKSFTINRDNAQLLQSFDPPRDRQSLESVELSIQGVGVGLVQLAMRYNVQNNRALDSGDYNIIVARETMARKRRDTNSNDLESSMDREVGLKACVKPTNPDPGMVLLEVGIPTGFEGNLAGTQAANRRPNSNDYNGQLKQIELSYRDRKFVFYFDTLETSRYQTCVSVKITRTLAAKNVQAAPTRVYKYYEPSRMNATEFSFPGMSIDDTDACQDVRLKIPCPN